jgi:hypothetical protein
MTSLSLSYVKQSIIRAHVINASKNPPPRLRRPYTIPASVFQTNGIIESIPAISGFRQELNGDSRPINQKDYTTVKRLQSKK